MSHFSVLVIGDNVEEQLQPYHEFECTDTDDQYVQNVDRTEEAREKYKENGESERTFAEWAIDWYGLNLLGQDNMFSQEGHKYGWIRVDDNGDVIEIIDRTNPDKKWDWWVIGGRWGGFLSLKKGGKGDSAAKKAVDWDAMRKEGEEAAAEKYDLVHSIINGRTFTPWDEMRRLHEGDIDAARAAYHGQEVIKDLNANRDTIFIDPENFLVTREKYVEAGGNSAISTFAVVKDGQWYERGSMGWWGIVTDEMAKEDWDKKFSELIDGLPADTLLTVVDCHI